MSTHKDSSPSSSTTGAPLSELVLREALPDDIDFLRDLVARLFLQYGSYDRYVEDWFGHDLVSTEIAESGGEAVGFAMLALHPVGPSFAKATARRVLKKNVAKRAAAELLAIAVEPRWQSKGVGQALLDRCLLLVRESDLEVSEMKLTVAEGNARARRLFARNGFRLQTESSLYPAGQRALFMIKTLEKEIGS